MTDVKKDESIYWNSEAEELMGLLLLTDTLERRSRSEICGLIEQHGDYVQVAPGCVTVEDASGYKQNAVLLTKDHAIIELCIGMYGRYSIRVLVEDCNHPTAEEAGTVTEDIADLLLDDAVLKGKRLMTFLKSKPTFKAAPAESASPDQHLDRPTSHAPETNAPAARVLNVQKETLTWRQRLWNVIMKKWNGQ